MIPISYQNNLEKQLERSHYLLLLILLDVLQSIKQVSIEALANALPLPILFESRRRKIQRFLSIPCLKVETIWLPIIKQWLADNFAENSVLYVVIDRTSWGNINLLMISLIYEQRAIPIYFGLLPKLGSSNLREQQAFIAAVLPLFKNYKTVVLGDREFCSVQLGYWLREQKVYFCLRLKKSEFVLVESDMWVQLKNLGLSPGVALYLQGVKVTKTRGFTNFNVACKWRRKYLKWAPEEGWFILTNLDSLSAAITAYKKRFRIEEMFRDFKSGGYNLEGTNVSGERLIAVVILIAIAYTSATMHGRKINQMGVQKYVARVKEAGRSQRRHSSFYIGLSSQIWVSFIEKCNSPVSELMKISPNKLPYYQRGLRAMKLIIAAS
jgi:hypothetical protein